MSSEIWCALISGVVTLVVSIGTWHMTAKKDRSVTQTLLQTNINDLKDDISGMKATFQQQIAVFDIKLEGLKESVDKHNQVVERTYKLEQAVEDMKKAM